MRPHPSALGIPAVVLALLGCSLFNVSPPSPEADVPPADGDVVAIEPPVVESQAAAPSADGSPSPDSFSLVVLHPSEGDLAELLALHAGRSGELGLAPFVEFSPEWCPSCVILARSLGDERMVDAFRGTYIIRLDIDEWNRSLPGTGFRVIGVPTFFEVDAGGAPTGRMLTGAAWGEDVVENMAPLLKEFFAGG